MDEHHPQRTRGCGVPAITWDSRDIVGGPEWFNEEDFSQLKLIRDQWI